MAEAILVRELPSQAQVEWLDLAAPADGVRSGSLAELANLARERTLVLVWPAAQVLLLEVELPLRSAAQIAKALPYALEDFLAADVDAYHLSWHRAARARRIAVAAVSHEKIAACIARFAAAGLLLSMALPEPLLLPWQHGQCALLLDGDNGVFRNGEWLGGGGERDLCGVVLEKLYADGQAEGGLQLWFATGGEDFGLPLPVETERRDGREPLPLYAEQWRAASGLNLLTGAYAPQSRRAGNLTAWLPAALILLIALLAQLAGQWQLLNRQQQQLQSLQADSQALFRQTFPDIKRLVNLKVQADQQLAALQTQSRQQTAGFLGLLHRAGNRLKADPQFKPRRLQFAEDGLHIILLAADAAGVEQYQRLLSDEDGLRADIRGLTSVTDGVEADLVIQQN